MGCWYWITKSPPFITISHPPRPYTNCIKLIQSWWRLFLSPTHLFTQRLTIGTLCGVREASTLTFTKNFKSTRKLITSHILTNLQEKIDWLLIWSKCKRSTGKRNSISYQTPTSFPMSLQTSITISTSIKQKNKAINGSSNLKTHLRAKVFS